MRLPKIGSQQINLNRFVSFGTKLFEGRIYAPMVSNVNFISSNTLIFITLCSQSYHRADFIRWQRVLGFWVSQWLLTTAKAVAAAEDYTL